MHTHIHTQRDRKDALGSMLVMFSKQKQLCVTSFQKIHVLNKPRLKMVTSSPLCWFLAFRIPVFFLVFFISSIIFLNKTRQI